MVATAYGTELDGRDSRLEESDRIRRAIPTN
jgi:hypothetical protein